MLQPAPPHRTLTFDFCALRFDFLLRLHRARRVNHQAERRSALHGEKGGKGGKRDRHDIPDFFSGILTLPPPFRLTSHVARRMNPCSGERGSLVPSPSGAGFDTIVNLLYIVEVRFGQAETAGAKAPRLVGRLQKEPAGFSGWRAKTPGGRTPTHPVWRYAEGRQTFKGVGSGVLEIALRYSSDADRVVLAVQIGRRIYILHAFQKKSKKGVETSKRDVDLIRKRYTEAQELAHEYENAKTIEFEKGSGSVYADLGLKDADQLLARAQIGFHVFKILEDKKLKQREIAGVLGIAQPDVSHLMNGHFSRFTTDKLLDFLKRLDRKVTIEVSPHHKGEPYQQVIFAS